MRTMYFWEFNANGITDSQPAEAALRSPIPNALIGNGSIKEGVLCQQQDQCGELCIIVYGISYTSLSLLLLKLVRASWPTASGTVQGGPQLALQPYEHSISTSLQLLVPLYYTYDILHILLVLLQVVGYGWDSLRHCSLSLNEQQQSA